MGPNPELDIDFVLHVRRENGRLVGGLYGVSLGAAFFGESMFTRVRDASKVCLVYLVGTQYGGMMTETCTPWNPVNV